MKAPVNEIAYGLRPRQPTDLILITDHSKVSESAPSLASLLHNTCTNYTNKISDKIARNNANYELRAYVKNILKTFNVGDVKKLHACSADPFHILNKLNSNVYVINFGNSSTLNVKDLVDYKSLDFILLVDKLPEPIFEFSFSTPRYFT